jgi:hypothetical protein
MVKRFLQIGIAIAGGLWLVGLVMTRLDTLSAVSAAAPPLLFNQSALFDLTPVGPLAPDGLPPAIPLADEGCQDGTNLLEDCGFSSLCSGGPTPWNAVGCACSNQTGLPCGKYNMGNPTPSYELADGDCKVQTVYDTIDLPCGWYEWDNVDSAYRVSWDSGDVPGVLAGYCSTPGAPCTRVTVQGYTSFPYQTEFYLTGGTYQLVFDTALSNCSDPYGTTHAYQDNLHLSQTKDCWGNPIGFECETVPDWHFDEGDWSVSGPGVFDIPSWAIISETVAISMALDSGIVPGTYELQVFGRALTGTVTSTLDVGFDSENPDARAVITLTSLNLYSTTVSTLDASNYLRLVGLSDNSFIDWVCLEYEEYYTSPFQYPLLEQDAQNFVGYVGTTEARWAVPIGTMLYAVYTGTIEYVYDPEGIQIISAMIDHGDYLPGWRSYYSDLTSPMYSDGDLVGIGCPIGTTGRNPNVSLYLYNYDVTVIDPWALLSGYPDGTCGTRICLNINSGFEGNGAPWAIDEDYVTFHDGHVSLWQGALPPYYDQGGRIHEMVSLPNGSYVLELTVMPGKEQETGFWGTEPGLGIDLPNGEYITKTIRWQSNPVLPAWFGHWDFYSIPFTITSGGSGLTLGLGYDFNVSGYASIVLDEACIKISQAPGEKPGEPSPIGVCLNPPLNQWAWNGNAVSWPTSTTAVISPTGSIYNTALYDPGNYMVRIVAASDAGEPLTATITWGGDQGNAPITHNLRIVDEMGYQSDNFLLPSNGMALWTIGNLGPYNLTISDICIEKTNVGNLYLGRLAECDDPDSIVPAKYNEEFPGLTLDIGLYFDWLAKMLYDNVAWPILCFLVMLYNLLMSAIEKLWNIGIYLVLADLIKLLTDIYDYLRGFSLQLLIDTLLSLVNSVGALFFSLIGFLLCLLYALLAWLILRLQVLLTFGGLAFNTGLAWGVGAVNIILFWLAVIINEWLPWLWGMGDSGLVWLNDGANSLLAWLILSGLQMMYDILGIVVFVTTLLSSIVLSLPGLIASFLQIITNLFNISNSLFAGLHLIITGDFSLPLVEMCADWTNLDDPALICKIMLGVHLFDYAVGPTVPLVFTVIIIAFSGIKLILWTMAQFGAIAESLKL